MNVQVRGGKIPPKEHRKLLTEDAVNDLLERMIFAKHHDAMKGARSDCLFMPHEMGPMWTRAPDDTDRMFWAESEVNHPELVWPVGVGIVFHKRNNDEWGDHLHCIYAQSVDAKKLRGRYKFVGKHNLAVYEGFLEKGDKWSSAVNYAAWHWGKWRDAGRVRYDEAFMQNVRPEGGAPVVAGYRPEEGELSIGDRAALAQSMALTYRYEWGAQFAIEGSARIIVPVTPEGALELFNDRDKPADHDRRAALRHWVSQHLRKKPGGDFSGVRAHLRGATTFNWRGFDVVLRPSQFDEERAGNKS